MFPALGDKSHEGNARWSFVIMEADSWSRDADRHLCCLSHHHHSNGWATTHPKQDLSSAASLTGKTIRQPVYLPLPKIHPRSQVQDVAPDLGLDKNMPYKYTHYHVASLWRSLIGLNDFTCRAHNVFPWSPKTIKPVESCSVGWAMMWLWEIHQC